jgi:mono/diheme cytochrome c family protein
MNRFQFLGLALSLAVCSAHAELAGDSAEGQRLHEANCTRCHNTSAYTDEDHKVDSLNGLKLQVEGCVQMIKKDFSAEQKQSLVKFLNERYYHFK